MKKFMAVFFAALMVFSFGACQQQKTLVVGLDDSFPPMGFRDEKGEIVGFDIDLAKEACKRMGVEATFQPIDWNSKEMELNTGKIDLLWNGVTITETRLKEMTFTKPYIQNTQIILTRPDTGITTKADLAGKIIGLQAGSSALDALMADAETYATIGEVSEYAENILAFQDLIIGRTDAVVVDEPVARYYMTVNQPGFIVLEEDFGKEDYGVAMKLGNTDLLAKLQKALDDMVADGTAAEISKKWFEEDIMVK